MRKVLAASMAVLLSAGMTFSSLASVKLDAPKVRWNSSKEAVPEFSRIEGAGGSYQVETYKDSEFLYTMRHSYGATNKNDWLSAGGWINDLSESGIYKFRVMALGAKNSDTESSDWSDWSSEWTFVKPNIQFGIPSNLHWDGTTACWDAPTDSTMSDYSKYFSGYEVTLIADDHMVVTYNRVTGTSVSFTEDEEDYMDEQADYTFAVRVISNTPSKIFHGDLVYSDDSYNAPEENKDLSDSLDSILSNSEAADAAAEVAKLDKDKLAAAMQSDETVTDKIKELDDNYAAAANVATGVDISEDSEISEAEVTGMALNAEPNTSISFHVSKPERDAVVDSTAYKNAIQFSFKVENDGKNVPSLKVPMQIRIKLPADYDADHLRILHYNEDNKTIKEIIHPRVEDGYAIITVTSFSTFVFAEEGVDIINVQTPSNATEWKALASAICDLASEPSEEEIRTGLAKIYDCIADNKVKASEMMDDLDLIDVLDQLTLLYPDDSAKEYETERSILLNYAAGGNLALGLYRNEKTNLVNFDVKAPATSSNAVKKLSFTINAVLTDEDGKETTVTNLKAPMSFSLTIPEECGYTYDPTDTIKIDGGNVVLNQEYCSDNTIAFYTTKLGTFTITKKSSSNSSSSGSSHSGSSSSRTGRTRTYKSPVGGKWAKQADGTYTYIYADGSLALDCWIELSGKWYHIDKNHLMTTGWFKENGNWFYLNPASGADNGAMMTGWQKIDGKWYYLNEKSDGFKGILFVNGTTPDGYTVDGNGVWVK